MRQGRKTIGDPQAGGSGLESLSVVDCNAFLGHWAFRRLRRNDARGLLGMMDDFGVERACVASADAILYRDVQAGNEQVFEETRLAPDRFWLYATVNPAYPGWRRDLARCVNLGFKAIRVYPCYHGYRLDDPEADALAQTALEAGLPISAPHRVEDPRQRHRLDIAGDLDPLEFVRFAERHPQGAYLLTEGLIGTPRDSDLWARLRALNFYVEHSRTTGVLGKDLQIAVECLGADRVLFGTGFPFKTPSPAFLKLQTLDADADVKSAIAGGNAWRLFGKGV